MLQADWKYWEDNSNVEALFIQGVYSLVYLIDYYHFKSNSNNSNNVTGMENMKRCLEISLGNNDLREIICKK